MADYYKLVGSSKPTTDWTSEVILEKDKDGNVTKSVGVNRPAQLNKEDLDALKSLGFETEKATAEEAKQAEAIPADSGVLASAPLIGEGTNPGSSSAKNDK